MQNQSFLLKTYAITVTAVLGYLLLSGNTTHMSGRESFEEINVQRINIVEPNGDLKLVISNQRKQHPGMIDGKILGERERPAGMIFFNEEQDEVGGLVYAGNKKDGASWVLSVDQFKNDQIMQMKNATDKNGNTSYGLDFWQRDRKYELVELVQLIDSMKKKGIDVDETFAQLQRQNGGKPVAARRMFVGKQYNNNSGMFIQDEFGTDRLRVYVDGNNQPKIEVLDKSGKVVRELIK